MLAVWQCSCDKSWSRYTDDTNRLALDLTVFRAWPLSYMANSWAIYILLDFWEYQSLLLLFHLVILFRLGFCVKTRNIMFRVVFWDILPCKMIVDRRFRGAYCLHHQGWVNNNQYMTWNVYQIERIISNKYRILFQNTTIAFDWETNEMFSQVSNAPDEIRTWHLQQRGILATTPILSSDRQIVYLFLVLVNKPLSTLNVI
jgi:hypothetical protein